MLGSLIKRGVSLTAIIAAGVVAVVFAGVLQEFAPDEIPALAAEVGVGLPLAEPNVYVSTERGVLELRDGDVVVKRYDCGFGAGVTFGRLGRDARCTPLGEYKVVCKEVRKDVTGRGSRFLRIDFPNAEDAAKALAIGLVDRDQYEELRAAAAVDAPPPDGPLGGPLGIQGNYFFWTSRHFSDGSVALSNGAVNELFAHLPVGAPVVIGE